MLKHETQYKFEDYAVKTGEDLTEETLNNYNKHLKKELDDAYNFISIFAGLPVMEYMNDFEYSKGEIVSYKNKTYISKKKTLGNLPTDKKSWSTFEDFSKMNRLEKLSNYLSRTNQTEYEPNHLGPEEYTVDYHPATVKFVNERINYHLKNSVIHETKRLGGHGSDYFGKQPDIAESKRLYEVYSTSRLTPYSIPFMTDSMHVITETTDFEKDVLTLEGFETLYKEIGLRVDLRFGRELNKIVSPRAYTEDDNKIIELNILGPFKGFGCEIDDWTCGEIFLKITNSMNTLNVKIESTCKRTLTQEEYNALTNKSEYVIYAIKNLPQTVIPEYVFWTKPDVLGGVRTNLYYYPNRDVTIRYSYCTCYANTPHYSNWGEYGCTCHSICSCNADNKYETRYCTNDRGSPYANCPTNASYNCPANLNGLMN